ncbi:MAG: tRNA pseudouridine38-40 synthase [Ascidiaceihabitans sp.]|jgi:tRNA pseudouridine38-40 synthase
MPRYAIKVEYHGGPFSGWQRQNDRPSVQGAIEAALAKIEPNVPKTAAAGRTDAGVHGLAQVAHIDLKKNWGTFRLTEALNYHLKPNPVSIVDCAEVSEDWHARFSARERRYLFRILMRRPPSAHMAGLVWQVKEPLDIDAMRQGAQHLIGHHDFTTFRSSICQSASPSKTLDELRMEQVETIAGPEIHFHVRARSFLHNQVRSFVGTLERVGAHKWSPDRVASALAACDREKCGPVSPPYGLYLAGVEYDNDPFDQSLSVNPAPAPA